MAKWGVQKWTLFVNVGGKYPELIGAATLAFTLLDLRRTPVSIIVGLGGELPVKGRRVDAYLYVNGLRALVEFATLFRFLRNL